MALRSSGAVEGHALHLKVADRMIQRRRRLDLRDARDLALVAALAAIAPLSVLAIEVEAARPISASLMILTLVLGGYARHLLAREYGVDLNFKLPTTVRRRRWEAITGRIVPLPHHRHSPREPLQINAQKRRNP